MKPLKKSKGTIWILVYTKFNQETKAQENLEKQGFKTFLPLILPTNKRKQVDTPVPVFPRYLFVKIDLSLNNWTSIKSSYGVRNIVMFSEKFTPIPDFIIKLIQDRLDESGVYKEDITLVDYQKGDAVSIKEGRLAGVDAIFLSKKSKDRVRLLLTFLNTSVIAEITESDIGQKELIKNFKF